MNSLEVKKAARHIKRGGIIIYPTETAYAIGCNARNRKVVHKIMNIKGRPRYKIFSIIVSDIAMAKEYAHFSKKALSLAKMYWPGPLTLILPSKKALPKPIVNEKEEVALRISSHPIPKILSKTLKFPIVATSANRSGRPTCYSVTSLKKQFGKKRLKDIFIINVGVLPKRKTSTMLRITREEKVFIIRKGAIAFHQL